MIVTLSEKLGRYTWKATCGNETYIIRHIHPEKVEFYHNIWRLQRTYSSFAEVTAKIKYIGVENGQPFLLEKYMRVFNLRQFMQNGAFTGNLERTSVLKKELIHAISALHRHDIVHGDIKPENILLPAPGLVVFIDFEFGGIVGIAGYARSTGFTPLYCSSEQVKHGVVTKACDIRAIEIICREAYLGEHPIVREVGMDTSGEGVALRMAEMRVL